MSGASSVRDLRALVRGDYEASGRDGTRPGFRAMFVQRFGAWRYTVQRRVLRAPLSVAYRIAHRYVRGRYGIEIHDTTVVGARCHLAHQSGIVVHEHAVIGSDCLIRQGVTIGQLSGTSERTGVPTIGDRVQIGAGAVIVGPIRIGDDAVIAPNSVVMTDVPCGATVSGPVARVVAVRDAPQGGGR